MKQVYGWVIYPKTKCSMDEKSYQWIIQQAFGVGVEVDILFIEDISCLVENGRLSILNKGKEVEKIPDFAIMRGYDFVIMHHIEMMGIYLFNNHDAMYNSFDKFTTHQILTKNSIETPKTLYNCRNYNISRQFFKNDCFIVKHPKGNRGNEVHLVNNREEFDVLCKKYDQILSQEIIESSHGRDIRVWVVGDKAVDAVMRYNKDSFKSNFSQGGSVSRIEIDSEIENLAVKSSLFVGLDFSGVDILITENGYSVCEVNGNAAFRSLSTFGDEITIPQKLFNFIKEKTKIRDYKL